MRPAAVLLLVTGAALVVRQDISWGELWIVHKVGRSTGGQRLWRRKFAVMSHYDVLGVAPNASAVELRHAYRSRASLLHPDKHTDRPPQEQADTARDMQRLNEAWHVLSDAARRRRYDEELGVFRATPLAAARPSPLDRSDESIKTHDSSVPVLLRLLPLGFMLLVLLAVFVFAAFALSGPADNSDGNGDTGTSPSSPTAVAAGDCIDVERGRISALIPCEGPNDGRVTRVILRADACVGVEQRVDGIDGSRAICVVATTP